MNAVFFEANHDGPTQRVHFARKKALASVAANSRTDLYGSLATASEIQSTHRRLGRFGLFSGMGHGHSRSFCGQLDLDVYDVPNSRGCNSTIRDSIVHLYSCHCAIDLGPHLVRSGAKAFIGYSREVSVSSSQVVAEEYVKVAAAIDRSILNGDSPQRTQQKAEQAYHEARNRLLGLATATPRDLAKFQMNHRAMVGPWTNLLYGNY